MTCNVNILNDWYPNLARVISQLAPIVYVLCTYDKQNFDYYVVKKTGLMDFMWNVHDKLSLDFDKLSVKILSYLVEATWECREDELFFCGSHFSMGFQTCFSLSCVVLSWLIPLPHVSLFFLLFLRQLKQDLVPMPKKHTRSRRLKRDFLHALDYVMS